MKEEKNNFEFVKEPDDVKRNYIFQKNVKTKVGAGVILAFLGVLSLGVILSAPFFDFPEI